MRTATRLVILASLASLVLGPNPSDDLSEDEKEQMMASLPIECCELEKALPSIFTADPDACTGGTILKKVVDSKKGNAKDQEESCMVECILGEHALLTEDKSVKEAELRTLFLQKVNPDAKEVMTAALDECFEDHDGESHKDDTCKSGAEKLLSCIMSETFTNCPKKMWQTENELCKDLKETLIETVADTV